MRPLPETIQHLAQGCIHVCLTQTVEHTVFNTRHDGMCQKAGANVEPEENPNARTGQELLRNLLSETGCHMAA